MTSLRLVIRGLRYDARSNLALAAGAAVATAVLVGALAVGSSVKFSLRRTALMRLGDAQLALTPPGRTFRDALAKDLSAKLDAHAAAVRRAPAVASTPREDRRAGNVNVLGVDAAFWRLADAPDPLGGKADAAAVNETLAARLGCRVGDAITLRVEKPAALSREIPLTATKEQVQPISVTVAAIVADEQLGRFSLAADQLPPANVFVRRELLQNRLDRPGRANLLLIARRERGGLTQEVAAAALKEVWTLSDAELELHPLPGGERLELRSSRVFLSRPVAEAATEAMGTGEGLLTYFVNELRVGQRSTPYSFVVAKGSGYPDPRRHSPRRMDENETVEITQWLADDLHAKPGDTLTMKFFIIGEDRQLRERSAAFRVAGVLPMDSPAVDREMLPDYPGIAGAESCSRWKPGIDIDLTRIRDKDEAYWDAHRGTPKAAISLPAGRAMWANRWGSLTAIRWRRPATERDAAEAAILLKLDPASQGLVFLPVRSEALAAADSALDFGQLFLGLSFFLLASAVALTALLFAFRVEQRRQQIGTLLAVGWTPQAVRNWLLAEGIALAAIGGAGGVVFGLAYTWGLVALLRGVWAGAVAGSALWFHAAPLSVLGGWAAGVATAAVAMGCMAWRHVRKPARALLAGADDLLTAPSPLRKRIAALTALLGLVGAVTAGWFGRAARGTDMAAWFFLAGAAMLLGLLALCARVLMGLVGSRGGSRPGRLAVRNAARRRGRSLAIVGTMACGVFLVLSVGANRQDPTASDPTAPRSGTGGFALYAESSVPIFVDLNTKAGRDTFGLSDEQMRGVRIVSMLLRDGDDASCLNLNRSRQPRLLGAAAEALAGRFAFVTGDAWPAAMERPEPNAPFTVPAVADEPTVVWGLDLQPGEAVKYADAEGREVDAVIKGMIGSSILQGFVLIREDHFRRLFPAAGGYRVFLIDAPPERAGEVRRTLEAALADVGLQATPTGERLARFAEVQNTYLAVFLVLGALGMVLGTVALGVLLLRNVLERRSELALLRAVGFSLARLRRAVFAEHAALALAGLLSGTAAAAVASAPAFLQPTADVPWALMGGALGVIAATALAFSWLAAGAALRGELLDALRRE